MDYGSEKKIYILFDRLEGDFYYSVSLQCEDGANSGEGRNLVELTSKIVSVRGNSLSNTERL